MESEERWKEIDEAPNYEVSNLGNVRNLTTGRLLALNHSTGTPSVLLRDRHEIFRRSVPRLVNLAFDPSEAGENWRTCKDAPRYSVSDQGRVMNNRTGRLMKVNALGRVSLRDAGWTINRSVADLMEEEFGGE